MFIAILLSVNLGACGKSLPNPVEHKDGCTWIPIGDTNFLIPEKTWLKSYARNSTDGLVSSFNLHATAPDVQPWSQSVNAKMYPPAGPGQMVDVEVRQDGNLLAGQYELFYQVPQSRWGGLPLEEVQSDLAAQGLRKFRDTRMKFAVIYEHIEGGRVKYFIDCNENQNAPNHQHCDLSFPWGKTIYVGLSFTRNYLPHSIQMAEKVTAKLKEFETAGHAFQRKPSSNKN